MLCKKKAFFEYLHNFHVIKIFITAIVTAMKFIYEGWKLSRGKGPVSSELKRYYFFSILQYQILDNSSGFDIIVCRYIWALKIKSCPTYSKY